MPDDLPDNPAPVSLAERLRALESRPEPTDSGVAPEVPPAKPAPVKTSPAKKATAAAPAAAKATTAKAAATPKPATAKPAAAKPAAAKAAATSAPAKKAAPVKAPAKPAAAKAAPVKAPAKPATATTAVAGATAAAKAPAKTAPAKAAAPKATAPKAPARKTPAKKTPAKKMPPVAVAASVASAAAPPAPAVAEPALPVPAERISAAAAGAAVTQTPPVQLFDSLADPDQAPPPAAPPRRTPGIYRVLIVLTVVLLAGALGLFAAAIVESGQQTWSSTITVQLLPGQTATDLSHAQQQYVALVPKLTNRAAAQVGVPSADVWDDLVGTAVGTDQIRITAKTVHAGQAESLAGSGADLLVQAVALTQQQTVPDASARLSGLPSSSASPAEQTSPSDTMAAVVGVLVAGGVLLLALTLWLIRRSAKD